MTMHVAKNCQRVKKQYQASIKCNQKLQDEYSSRDFEAESSSP